MQHLADTPVISLSLVEVSVAPRSVRNSRSRLVSVTRATAAFYAEQLGGDEAAPAREYLTERGFDAAAAKYFGCGFAPSGWDSLIEHLARQGCSIEEMGAAAVYLASDEAAFTTGTVNVIDGGWSV